MIHPGVGSIRLVQKWVVGHEVDREQALHALVGVRSFVEAALRPAPNPPEMTIFIAAEPQPSECS